MKNNCTGCTYFKSWREDFFGDELEPNWCGMCMNDKSPHHNAGDDQTCELFTPLPDQEAE